MRCMALMNPRIDEERLVMVCFDEGCCVRRRAMQICRGPTCAAVEHHRFIITVGRWRRCAVCLRIGQMPFPKVRRAVTRLMKEMRQRGRFRIQPVGHVSLLVLLWRSEVLMDGIAGWIMSGHQSGAAGRAYWIENIEVLKIRPLAGQAINVRRLQPRMPMARQVAPAPVIGEDEDHVRSAAGLSFFSAEGRMPNEEGRKQERENEDNFHGASGARR